jgi:hypothetical protein
VFDTESGTRVAAIPVVKWRPTQRRPRGPLVHRGAPRDQTCRFPGCSNRLGLDAHHAKHWIDGGETKLSGVFLTCRRHHRHLHEHGFSAEMRDGQPVFFDPHGREIPPAPARPPLTHDGFDWLRASLRRSDVHISAETSGPGWDGWPGDYDLCVAAIGG